MKDMICYRVGSSIAWATSKSKTKTRLIGDFKIVRGWGHQLQALSVLNETSPFAGSEFCQLALPPVSWNLFELVSVILPWARKGVVMRITTYLSHTLQIN